MMPEILTESFCERCGTRYTFESSAPRKTRRLGQFKTLSKGLKNYVLSDDTSMDEAMAAARSDEERETTAQQLDAFHSTFNFCMNCRQYTCGNCWNQAEGRCLTCSPNLGRDILPAPFPDDGPFAPLPIAADAWPTADLPPLDLSALARGENGGNAAAEAVTIEPTNGVVHDAEAADDDAGAHFSFLTAVEAAQAERAEIVAAETALAEAAEAAEAERVRVDAAAAATMPPAADLAPLPDSVTERAATLASHTAELFGRFRPGQNIDAELAAFEAGLDVDAAEAVAAGEESSDASTGPSDVVIEPAVVADSSEPERAPLVAAAWPEPDPEIVAAAWPDPEREALVLGAEQESVLAEAEPELIAEPYYEAAEAEPELIAEAEPEAAPVAADPVRKDRIEQPTWQIFAPDQNAPAGGPPVTMPVPPTSPSPVAPPPAASADPQWPTRPDVQESPSMALLANRTRASSDALWAASTQEVLSPAATGPAAATTGVQPCSNCGLSLSATARFCRRCGTRQG